MPSIVAEIGWAIEDHLQKIGLLANLKSLSINKK